MRITSPQPLSEGEGLNSPNKVRLLFFIGVCNILMSCGGSQKPASAPQTAAPAPIARQEIPRDSVITLQIPSDPTQSYSIYYPSTAQYPENMPILVCFDPHGDGEIPISKYKKWADKYEIAIAGSNSSRNGLSGPEGQQIAANMISDLSSHLGFDKKNMTLCGFSGGAKVAINDISADGQIPNLIYAGAVTQLSSSRPLNILGFAGNQDMNYTDLLQFDESVRANNPNSTLIEFNGKHEWPDVKTFENAFYFLSLQAQKQKGESTFVKAYVTKTDEAIASAEKKGDLIAAYQDCHTAYVFLNRLTDVSSYNNKMASISSNPQYQKAILQRNDAIGKESNQKQILLQAFQNQGSDWWTKVISGYRSSTNPSDKRLLGFISLASFSYSSQMLQQHNLDGAERLLSIYEQADPTNTDQLYFHAMLYAQKSNNAVAIKYLKKALDNGFTDLAKMEAEPSFTQLRNDPGYAQIVAALKKVSR